MADNTILSRLDGLKLKYEETGQKLTEIGRASCRERVFYSV